MVRRTEALLSCIQDVDVRVLELSWPAAFRKVGAVGGLSPAARLVPSCQEFFTVALVLTVHHCARVPVLVGSRLDVNGWEKALFVSEPIGLLESLSVEHVGPWKHQGEAGLVVAYQETRAKILFSPN